MRDILDRCDRILRYSASHSLESFLQDDLVRDAVERSFQVIGDAIKALPEDVLARDPSIPWALLARFRDVVVHAYFRLDPVEVWTVIQDELPLIRAQVQGMLDGTSREH